MTQHMPIHLQPIWLTVRAVFKLQTSPRVQVKHEDGEEKQRPCICPPGPRPVLAFPAHISAESRRDSHQDACVSYDLKSHLHFIMRAVAELLCHNTMVAVTGTAL